MKAREEQAEPKSVTATPNQKTATKAAAAPPAAPSEEPTKEASSPRKKRKSPEKPSPSKFLCDQSNLSSGKETLVEETVTEHVEFHTKHPKMDKIEKRADWTKLIDRIENIHKDSDGAELLADVLWEDGVRTVVPAAKLNERAPLKVMIPLE